MLCQPLLGAGLWRPGAQKPNEHGFVEDSWDCGQTQNKNVHKNPSDRLMRNQRRKGVNQARVAGDTNGDRRDPTRRNDKPGQPESHQEIGFTSSSAQNNEKDDDQQPSHDGSRLRGPN